jgi:uncharacterized protein (DUF2336 family)
MYFTSELPARKFVYELSLKSGHRGRHKGPPHAYFPGTDMTVYGSLIKELEDAISCTSADRRAETLSRVTDLFISAAGQYSDDQISLFDDVIGRLAAEIEIRARAKLAARLAPLANAPDKVIHALAADDAPEVAGPVLAKSPRLDEATLIDTAKTKGQQHLLAISTRPGLGEAVTDVLVERGDQQVVRTVSKNTGARFSDTGFGILVKRSEGDDILAERIGLRRDIPRHHFLKLIANASDTVRTKLAASIPDATADIHHVLAQVVGKMRAESVTASTDYSAAKKSVDALFRTGNFGEDDVYALAKLGKFEETTVAMSLLCGLPIDVIETAMLDNRPDMILIMSKFAGLSWTAVKAILLLRAGGKGVSPADLDQALRSFERLQPDIAHRVVRFYQVRQRSHDDD